MKFLKAVRLDDSDDRIYAGEGGAARDGEWLVSGGFAACDLAAGHRRAPCHCDTSFLTAGSGRRCTLAEVAEISEMDYAAVCEALAQFLLQECGAPDGNTARRAAEDECAYTADLAEGFPSDVWITVRREATADGVGERYSVYKRLMIGAHKL